MTPSVSALYWFPLIKAARLPVPRTEFVPVADYLDLIRLFDGDEPHTWKDLCSRVDAAASIIGEPCFLRTDIGSAKHSGPKAYRFPGSNNLRMQPLVNTIEDHECKHMFGPEASAFMLREFLDLDAPFTAFGGLPIAREWRFFADDNHVFCAHPYWPTSSIEENFWNGPEPVDWRERLAALNEIPAEFEQLSAMAIKAAAACGAFPWSVDFARDRGGKYWLIDMAPMSQSWHWEDCPNNPEKRP